MSLLGRTLPVRSINPVFVRYLRLGPPALHYTIFTFTLAPFHQTSLCHTGRNAVAVIFPHSPSPFPRLARRIPFSTVCICEYKLPCLASPTGKQERIEEQY